MQKSKNSAFTIAAIVLAACLFYALSGGIRSNYGLIRGAISASSGADYAAVSFVLAVAQLSFGVMQPVFGIVALKKSNGFVLAGGAILTAAGLFGIPLCRSAGMLMVFMGLLMPMGLAAFSFGIIMGAVTPMLGERRAATVSGFVSASSGLGSIILAPVLRSLLDSSGLWGAVLSLAIPAACLTPAALWLSRSAGLHGSAEERKTDSLRVMLGEAVRNRSYRCLVLAFFTCGFHMAIIETHLYTQFTSYGFSDATVAYVFSVYGITTMLGSVVSGFLCSRVPMQYVLGSFYGSRTIWIVGFILLPKTLVSVYCYAALLGFTGAATVPPTSALVNRLFGPARLGTLFGVAFVAHQLGSFFSAWLGGICVAATGGYTLIWLVSAGFSLCAAALSYSVKTE